MGRGGENRFSELKVEEDLFGWYRVLLGYKSCCGLRGFGWPWLCLWRVRELDVTV